MEEEINLLEYSYPDGTMIEIPGRLLEGLIQILTTVDNQETTKGFINKYPVTSKENFVGETLESVDVTWAGYTTAESYFNQEPQEIKTLLGAMALDICLMLKQAHLENIKADIAKKAGSFEAEKPKEDVKLTKS